MVLQAFATEKKIKTIYQIESDLYSQKHGELCKTFPSIYLNNKHGKMFKLSINNFARYLKQNTSVYSIKYY